MKQAHGLFDLELRLAKIDKNGDPLLRLNQIVDFEQFRERLDGFRNAKARKSNAGRKAFDSVLMFKILIIQSLYNLSDDATEAQILDRLSFMRFLGLSLGSRVPDAKTIWSFREQLKEADILTQVFNDFDVFLRNNGFEAKKGQIVDASIVPAPKQRNTREENKRIKASAEIPEWTVNKRRQKDLDARWLRKNSKNYYGYKNHLEVDVKHKFIRSYSVSPASTHDSKLFSELLDKDNDDNRVWADSAYLCSDNLAHLKEHNYSEQLNRKGLRNHSLSQEEKEANKEKSRVRSRIEHIFGIQKQRAKTLVIRSIGIKRAEVKIALRNLAYNLDRYSYLVSQQNRIIT